MIWFDEFDDMQIVTAYGAEMEGLFQLFGENGIPAKHERALFDLNRCWR